MDTDFDSQAYSGSPAQLSNRDDHPIWEGQGDYPMVDVFDIQPEVDSDPQPEDRGISGFLDPLDSPLDYRFGASHMVILDNLPAEIPHYLSQEVDNILTVLLDSARDPIYGNEVSQSTRYWEFMGSPQSTHPEQSSGVCPRPTSLPSRPNLTSRPNNHAVMPTGNSGINGPSHPRVAIKYNQPPPSCDHTNCSPPPDVEFLSRRFAENGNWIRARASAVASLAYRRRGIYSLPIEILEMIPSQFPVIDSLNSWGAGKNLLQTWHRHMAFRVLAATSTRLRTIFYERSWRTRVTTETDLPVMVGFLKQIGVHVHGLFVEKLITQLPRDSTLLMRDCLLALPSLHTLVIVDGCYNGTGWIKSVFKHKPDFPQIRNVTIPAFAHPILSRLPNMEELVCYCNISWRSVLKPVLSSLRGPYVKERHGKVEPVLKSFTVICPAREWDFSEALAKKLPRLRKICLPEPIEQDMVNLRGLKEVIELEILVAHESVLYKTYNLDLIKHLAIQILQASECHKDCACDYKCGCSETNECHECNPPKRILRIKTRARVWSSRQVIADEGSCWQEIHVSPRRILSTK